MEEQRGSLQSVLITLLAAAFSLWAGVVLWGINLISSRLDDLEQAMEDVISEVGAFKLDLTQRITRAEAQRDRLESLEENIRRIDMIGPASPNREISNRVEQLNKRIETIEGKR